MDKPQDKVACVVCGKLVPYERSRLFWSPDGTYRTCSKGTIPHEQKKK
jgi:hypothetical protein